LKVLFDNNIPLPLRRFLPGHQVSAAYELGWHRLRNGDLLAVAETSGFEVMVTADQTLRYEQELTGRTIAIIALGSNFWPVVKEGTAEIAAALNAVTPGTYIFIEFPDGHKRGRRKD
jgi:hypothetical protein